MSKNSKETKKNRTKTIPANYMDIIFVHAYDKPSKVDETGLVTVDVTNEGFFNKIAQKFWKKPVVSHIELDKYGSEVWKALDGNNTVNNVLNIMNDKFPDEQDRMLDRVVIFLHTLQNNNYIFISDKK